MLRRARPAPVPAERVRRLLARPAAGGWVPPPEPGDGAAADVDTAWWHGEADRSDGPDEPSEQPATASWPSSAQTGGPPGTVPEPGSVEAATGGPGRSAGSRAARRAAHRRDGADRDPIDRDSADRRGGSSGPPTVLPVALRVLPVALRTGRLDPGRRGAAALVLVAVLGAVVAGGVLLRGRPQEVLLPEVLSSGRPLPGTSASPQASAVVVVAVAGEVARPGLVRLPAGSRVDDALRAAGGLAAGGSTGLLNLARRLVDGEQVLVGADAPAGAPVGAAPAGGLLDLNTATVAELDALPGIGPVLAQRIVDWRTENERFGSVDQLREVTGIGEAKFADLEKDVTV